MNIADAQTATHYYLTHSTSHITLDQKEKVQVT
jgi:hypothetical protein